MDNSIDPARIIIAMLVVLGLIGLMALGLRRLAASGKFSGSGMAMPGQGRLSIVETRYLDTRRRLVLVRRDTTEHLILISEGRELLIESNIPAPESTPHA